MSKNFLIKFKYFLFLVSSSVFNFTHSHAQVVASSSVKASNTDYMAIANNTIADTGKLIKNVNNNIAANLVILLSSIAFILFLYGLVRFIYDRSSGDDKDLEKDKKAMGWGLAALFVLISVWGIIKMFQGFLGIQNAGDINLPKICPNGTCTTNSGAVTPGNTGLGQAGGFNDPTKKLDVANKVDGTYDTESIRMWNIPLKEGMTGNSVETAQLQKFLKEHDTNSANLLGTTGPNQDGVDGVYGSNTTAAVKAFQKDNALAQDGIVGNSTKAVILYVYMNAQPTVDTYYVNNWPNIMTGGQSTDANTSGMVSRLQLFLVDQGYNIGNTGVQGIDGTYGGKTSTAVMQFQAKYSLKEDNLVGPSTRAVIKYIENGNN